MPAIKRVNVATTTDALANRKFKVIPPRGALISLFAAGVTAGDTLSLSVGNQEVVVDAEPNIEASADVVDTDRDAILVNERVPGGELFLPITATTAVNFLLLIDYV